MMDKLNNITVTCGQFDVKIGDKEYNTNKMAELAKTARMKYNSDLIVFPECCATGYGFSSLLDIKDLVEPVPGPLTGRMSKVSAEFNISILFGMLEKSGDECYNVIVYCEPDGTLLKYRKTHFPFLGIDRFLKKGDEISVFESRFGTIGLMVCYELRFPEVARQLSLKGARILLQPTNLPDGGEAHPNILTKARACENRVFLASCNRAGIENGQHFFGKSQIIDISGKVLAELGDEEGLISATVDLCRAENKDIIVIPNEYETYLFKDRRPELYDMLTKM